MPNIEGKEARLWIDAYVKKAGKLSGIAKAVRALVKRTSPGPRSTSMRGRFRRLI